MNNIEFNVYNKYEKSYSSAKAMAQAICPHNCANSGVCAFSSDNETIPCADEWPHLTCYYDIIDTSGATTLMGTNRSNFTHMRVDGNPVTSLAKTFVFDTPGEHIVKFYKKTIIDSIGSATNGAEFKGIKNLTKIEGLQNVKEAPYNSFNGCSNLISLDFSDKLTKIGGSSPFDSCPKLETIGSIESISGRIENSSFQNSGIKGEIYLPHVTYIDQHAFEGCTNLEGVTLGKYIADLRYYCFRNCTSLKYIKILNPIPPQLGNNDTEFVNTNNCPIYVPKESVHAYKTTGHWAYWANRIQPMPKKKITPDIWKNI